ncbi:MAG: HD domain-containing phosphohydrolase [Verrucomicrobiota bacterium]|jgi:response regulator RpfG family c-di-GMP phosphodiesterase
MSLPIPVSFPELNRILVVDDEQVVLAALRETLRLEGYEVFAVEDPIEGLRLLRANAFSVILIDQQMPGLTGLEFLAQAKQLQPNATRILITAVLSLGTVIDSINKGEVYRFIVKPWLREELLVTIRNAALRYELICRNAALHAEALALNDRLGVQLKQLEALNQTLHSNLDRSILLCLKTMETFFPLLGQQARRVFGLCQAMGHDLALPREQRRILEISSRLYDIGLVGAPRELIRKWQQTPDLLSDEERAIIQLHPALGQDLASFGAELEAVGPIIRAHHERFDGQGYPDQLSGERIPWLARLLAVAVAFAGRPSSEDSALEYIMADSGAAFDPDAVRALMRSLPQTVIPGRQREVLLAELQPGMVVAQGIYTPYGLLLVPEGQALTESHVKLLRNHNQITPITQSLLVYC